MTTPAKERLNAVGPGGYIVPSGLAALRDVLARPGVIATFDTWKGQQLTRLVAGAIRDLIMNQPTAKSSSENIAVQFGITQGLELAYQLLQDPSIILPGVFGSGTQPGAPGVRLPQENFDTPADGVEEK